MHPIVEKIDFENTATLSRFLFMDVAQEYDDFLASSLSYCQRLFRYDSRPVLSVQVGRLLRREKLQRECYCERLQSRDDLSLKVCGLKKTFEQRM